MSLVSDYVTGKKQPTVEDAVQIQKGITSGGMTELPNVIGGSKKKNNYDYGLGAKNSADAEAIASIEAQKKRQKTRIQMAAGEAMQDTQKTEQDFRKKLDKDRATLDKQKASFDKQVEKFSEQKMKYSENLSKWYEGIATSYEDIGKRYADAVVGLSKSEEDTMKGQSMQDFAAMSAITAQAYGTATQGRAMTGSQQAAAMGVASKQATDAYSASMLRMQDLNEQRRNQQIAIVTASNQQELANRQAGFSMQAGAINTMDMLEGNALSRSTGLQSMMTNMDQMSRGSSLNEIGSNFDYTNIFNQASFDADTYGAEAGIRIRNNAYAQGLAAEQINMAKDAAGRQQQGAMFGTIGGIAGAAAGAYAGGPAGAGAGYTAGSGIGQGLGTSF